MFGFEAMLKVKIVKQLLQYIRHDATLDFAQRAPGSFDYACGICAVTVCHEPDAANKCERDGHEYFSSSIRVKH